MTHRHWSLRPLLAVLLAVSGAAGTAAQTPAADSLAKKVDTVFARWDSTATPGCAAGVVVKGVPVLSKAYGMADLEHEVVNRPDTIFEAGSVSKQFTAAAVLLLARDGRLSLDDPVRMHVPELPDYAAAVTIRHMLQHTSGLRDWGTLVGLAGAPRTTRAYTHAHVLDLLGRQRALNFAPGTQWSYSNSGYNLAAIIVERVSGQPFAEFSRARIFEPLGMRHTSWRDDFRRVVKGRATAYGEEAGTFSALMPFENVHGNGGLLTTVGDLLRWNEHFSTPSIGDRSFVEEQQRPGLLPDGRTHGYALGLRVGTHKGVREVAHGGITGGYRAFLARYPDQQVSVSVLCNASTASADRMAHDLADLFLGDAIREPGPAVPVTLPAATLDGMAGLYRDTTTGEAASLVRDGDGLRVEGGPRLIPTSGASFRSESGVVDLLESAAGPGSRLRVSRPDGTTRELERVARAVPTVPQLHAFAGSYRSEEIELTLEVAVEHGTLVVKRRPDRRFTLEPLYADAFSSPLGTLRFLRDAGGRVHQLSIVTDRAWDVRFDRVR